MSYDSLEGPSTYKYTSLLPLRMDLMITASLSTNLSLIPFFNGTYIELIKHRYLNPGRYFTSKRWHLYIIP